MIIYCVVVVQEVNIFKKTSIISDELSEILEDGLLNCCIDRKNQFKAILWLKEKSQA
jgi:hypothetical protein